MMQCYILILKFCNIIEPTLEEGMTNTTNELVTVVEVPTVYGGEFGPTLVL